MVNMKIDWAVAWFQNLILPPSGCATLSKSLKLKVYFVKWVLLHQAVSNNPKNLEQSHKYLVHFLVSKKYSFT